VDFQIGHVQAHPALGGVLLFCHETGGDAPQRMWRYVPGDSGPKAFYPERNEEWITHEVWWANSGSRLKNNRVLFTIWPYDAAHEAGIHGLASVDGDGGDFHVHSRYKAWHTHGSPDGELVLGDDHERNIWLIRPWTGERRLLTQGHRAAGFDTHPHASFTPDSRHVVMNSSALGREAVVAVEIPEWERLPSAKITESRVQQGVQYL
jgi:oligogalacturonide lyase